MMRPTLFALAASLGIAGCAYGPAETGPNAAQPQAVENVSFEEDRKAILAMTGTFDVTFHFEETVALAPGYELKPVKETGGKELVFVVEDTGTTIRLQHLLVVGDMGDPIVVKHWRQDWIYEPARSFRYAGLERWVMENVSEADRQGAWAQKVYQVDDSPRYAAVARWSHDKGVSTWEPPVSWRPLPRRDATTRDDYHVVSAVNRHTVTPWGWSHEQDNEKISLTDSKPFALVRELGVNSYRRTNDFPHEATEAYWASTGAYWQAVRDRWDRMEASAAILTVDGKEPDNPLYTPLLDLAGALEAGKTSTEDAVAQTDRILAERVTAGQ